MIRPAEFRTSFFAVTAALAAIGCHAAPSTIAVETPTAATTGPALTTQPASQPATRPASQPTTRPATPASPVVNADGTVTFRLLAPRVEAAEVWGDWPESVGGGPMTRDASGIWSRTVGPIPSGVWSYQFKLDGQYAADHANPAWKPARDVVSSILDLPGGHAWDRRADVPRGDVRLHDYASTSLGRTRRLRVYTPAAYDRDPSARFPVLYLLHGSGDNESTWTEFGRANVILDNLIADGAATPMIVVMTDGHALGGGSPGERKRNAEAFGDELVGQVVPMIDARYRTTATPEARAVAGLSMGGNQAILVGLRHPERFAWIGGMSSAIRDPERDVGDVVGPNATTRPAPRLLWLSCGTEDFLLNENRHFRDYLRANGVRHEYHETPGKHAWPVWRDNLVSLLPRLFQSSGTTLP